MEVEASPLESCNRTSSLREPRARSATWSPTQPLLQAPGIQTGAQETGQTHPVANMERGDTQATGPAEPARSLGPTRYVHGTSGHRGY